MRPAARRRSNGRSSSPARAKVARRRPLLWTRVGILAMSLASCPPTVQQMSDRGGAVKRDGPPRIVEIADRRGPRIEQRQHGKVVGGILDDSYGPAVTVDAPAMRPHKVQTHANSQRARTPSSLGGKAQLDIGKLHVDVRRDEVTNGLRCARGCKRLERQRHSRLSDRGSPTPGDHHWPTPASNQSGSFDQPRNRRAAVAA